MTGITKRAFAVRGMLAGALGGALAAAIDYGISQGDALRFLPHGRGRLLIFLLALYAGLGALGGMLVGMVLRLLGWAAPDLARLASSSLAPAVDARDDAQRGGRFIAYLLVIPVVLFGQGAALYAFMLDALRRYHAHLPIAALGGTLAALLVVASVIMVFLLASALTPVVRVGPRVRCQASAPAGWLVFWWLVGLGLALAGVLVFLDQIQLVRRMPPSTRALLGALWGPVIATAALLGGHFLGRLKWYLLGRWTPRFRAWLASWLVRPLATYAFLALVLLLALGVGLAATWSVSKLILWRPLAMAGVALLFSGALVAGGIGHAWDDLRWPRKLLALLLIPLSLLAAARVIGMPERVRKAAFATGLAPSLISATQAVTDFDRDGFSSSIGFGADCNDRDATIHPGAFDWPDDGIDQNCNGHEATSQLPPRPPFSPLPPTVPKRPNILFITIDAVRADHVGAYGYQRPTTPVFDALAKDSVLFRHGWAHSPSTRYSVPALLIGRYESTIAWDARAHWPPLVLPENRLISESLKERGYETAALLSAHYFEPGWGLTQGFDHYDNSLAYLHANPFGGDPARTTGSSSRQLADLGISWLDGHARDEKPFFLWMHFYDPHYLWERHPEVPSFGDTDMDLYDGEVRFTDMEIGRVLDKLRAMGDWDNTIIVVTADHGEGFGEHGIKLHGYHIYTQQNLVPFLVRVPGLPPRQVDDPVGHIDIFPSLLNLIGAPDEPQLLGRSFVDLLLDGKTQGPPRLIFGEVEYEGPVVRKSVASKDWHLIYNVIPDDTFELYHIAGDMAEEHDLYGDPAPYVVDAQRELKHALAGWMDESALPPHFAERVAGNLSATPLAFERSIGIDLGDMLRVEGATLQTSRVRPGEAVELSVVMRALKPIPKGWRMFTHLASASGRFINADHEPVEGFVPLGRLRPGQYVRDPMRIVLPRDWPPGPLMVELGLWRGKERAPASSGQDHVVAATIEVGP